MGEPIRDVAAPATIAAIDASLGAYWAARGCAPGVAARDDARFTWSSADVPSWYFNGVMRADLPESGVDAAVAEAVAWFAARERAAGMLWCVGPLTHPPDLGQYLARHGFALGGAMPGMAADLHALPATVAAPAGLTVEEVGDAAALAAWANVVTAAFGQPPSFERMLLGAHTALGLGPDRPLRHFLARLEGRPVGASAGLVAAGVVGLYWVATLADARGRGVGAAVTLAPLLAARERGYHVGILHASKLGFPVYRRLGFHQYCTFDLWFHRG